MTYIRADQKKCFDSLADKLADIEGLLVALTTQRQVQ